MNKFKRIFVIVMDSVGIGGAKDAANFGQVCGVSDEGANTWKHIGEKMPNGLNVPTLESLGLGELDDIKGVKVVKDHKNSYVIRLNEASNGKEQQNHLKHLLILVSQRN